MPSQNIKVLSPHDPRGSVIWSAVIGAMLSATPTICADQQIVRTVMMIVTGFSACILLPLVYSWIGLFVSIALGWWFARRCQHRRLAFKVGLAFGAASVLGWSLALMIIRPVGLTSTQLLINTGIIIAAAAIVGFVFGLGNLAINWLFREVRYSIAEQDGTLCWNCAYKVGNPPISDRCSECGTPIHPPTKRRASNRLTIAAKLHARLILVVLLALISLVLVPRIWRDGSAISRLARALGPTARANRWAMLPVRASVAPAAFAGAWESMGVLIDAPGDSTKAFVVAYAPSPAAGQPTMQVQLLGLTAQPNGVPLPCYGSPQITCNLSSAEAEYVLEHGLPTSLIDALLDAAKAANWTPLPAGGANSGITELPSDGHFPSATNP